MSTEEIIAWARLFQPFLTEEECLEARKIYLDYRDEGQNHTVSLQYAGLL